VLDNLIGKRHKIDGSDVDVQLLVVELVHPFLRSGTGSGTGSGTIHRKMVE
jgi:hypothetical protein